MNKRSLALVLAVLVLLGAVAVFASLLNGREPTELWELCTSGAAGAAEDFQEFAQTGAETAWWSAVAEFRGFMQAYHFLQGETDPEYIWCNSVYGFLLQGPGRAGDQADDLAKALTLLSLDPEDVNGFEIISRVNNALHHGE